MDIASLENGLKALELDERLWLEPNLRLRQTAFEFVAVAEEFLHHPANHTQTGEVLQQRLTQFKGRLSAINNELFKRLRTHIRSGAYQPDALRIEFNHYTDYGPHLIGQPHYGLDGLDIALDGIFEFSESTHPSLSASEIVQYEPTPARVVLELIDRAGFRATDVFYDLGSGLGRVVLLVGLLSKITAKGIEIDPTLQAIANTTAQAFGLQNTLFIQGDARGVDYSDGTVFFMFTPFKGSMFQDVMLKLRQHTNTRSIKIFSYGASNFWLAAQPWLRQVGLHPINDFCLTCYESIL